MSRFGFRILPFVAAALVVLYRGPVPIRGVPRMGPLGGDACLHRAPSPAPDGAAPQEAPVPLPDDLRKLVDEATRKTVKWLLREQQSDGSWRSPKYGVLRSGQAYTPFVLHTLLSVPERLRELPKSRIDDALEFLRSRVTPEGALGYHDREVLEYPVYATSYAIRALKLAAPGDPLVAKMAAWLAGMQLVEKKGFEPKSPAYGGWSFGVGTLDPGNPGHMDLAHTRRALEALNDAAALTDEIKASARRFLGLMQKDELEIGRFPGVPGYEDVKGSMPFDGGFFFSPIVLAANKALWENPGAGRRSYFRSYSTATADGALALVAIGASDSWPAAKDPKSREELRLAERLRAASSWLKSHWQVDPAGIPRDHPEPWIAALRFYQLAAMTEAAAALRFPSSRMVPFAKRILELQGEDGSFVNTDSDLMKEDDPILATTLALIALARIAPAEAPESRPAGVTKLPDTRPLPRVFRADVAWSPDGRLLAFTEHVSSGYRQPGRWAVWIIGADGAGRRKLADGACVTWSPDGSELAYTKPEYPGGQRICVVRADGSHPVAITTGSGEGTIRDTQPAWSPKGDLIAFSSNRESSSDIYVMATNGTAVTRLTKDPAHDYSPSWSPDGKRIVFYRERADGKCQIVTIGADGKDEATVVKDDANNVFPSFLRGGRIGFGAERDSKASIMTVEPDGTKPVRLGVADAWFARWSPGGERVAYISGRFPESKIYLMNADTTGVRALEP